MEKEISPGVYLSVITRERWLKRIDSLEGEDLRFFVERCNRIKHTNIVIENIFGLSREQFIEILRELEPEFNEKDDFYAIRYAQPSVQQGS